METIYTIETGGMTAKLNKTEIDILHFIEGWLPTFTEWCVEEFGYKLHIHSDDVTAAVDMLILHGLLDHKQMNLDQRQYSNRMVSVPAVAATWMRENRETINSLHLMNDSDLFDDTEIATA